MPGERFIALIWLSNVREWVAYIVFAGLQRLCAGEAALRAYLHCLHRFVGMWAWNSLGKGVWALKAWAIYISKWDSKHSIVSFRHNMCYNPKQIQWY